MGSAFGGDLHGHPPPGGLTMRIERWFYIVPLRLRALFRRQLVETDLDDEFRDHVERQTEEYVRQGASPIEARTRALRAFGRVDLHKEAARDARGVAGIEHAVQDVTFAVRMLKKSAGFTTVAVLTLALGIGANTAIFGLAQAVMLRSMPYAHADRLVALYETDTHGALVGISKLDFQDWLRQAHSFAHIAAAGWFGATITRGTASSYVPSAQVSPELFQVLGVKPLEGSTGATTGQSVVISERYWRREFGAGHVIGQTLVVDDTGRLITGVMPAQFDYPHGVDIWIPQNMIPRVNVARTIRYWDMVADLKPGMTVDAAQREMSGVASRLAATYPTTNAGVGAKVMTLQESLIGDVKPTLLLLTGSAVLMLLLACANLANLMLVRGVARRREMAVRTALGATRSRLQRQLLTESLMLAVGGALLGLPVAVWGSAALRSLPQVRTLQFELHQSNLTLLLLAAAITMLTTVVFGMVPAVRAARVDVVTNLKEAAGRGVTSINLSGGLVAGEVAIATILCVGAALAMRSLSRLEGEQLGFDPDGVVVAQGNLTRGARGDARAPMIRRILDNVRQMPVVASAALADAPPFTNRNASTVIIEGEPSGETAHWHQALERTVSSDYFRTLRIPFKQGRDFVPADAHGEPCVVVNESFARTYLSWRAPVGAHIAQPEMDSTQWAAYNRGQVTWSTVVGVVGDVRDVELGTPPQPTVYSAYVQHPDLGYANIVARTRASPTAVASAISGSVKTVDPLADMRVADLRDYMQRAVIAPRIRTLVLAAFAALALVLASIGVYGVTSHVTAQRTAEIGIRMALGARSFQVISAVAGRIAMYSCAGLLIGITGAAVAARVIRALLYGIGPMDVAAFAGGGVVAMGIAAAAAWIPARRATRVDPGAALRSE